jgi:glycosyl transferase family 87
MGRVTAAVMRDLAATRDRLRDRRRLLAIALLGIAGGLVTVFLLVRGPLAGADALAYWSTVRIWLAGGDPFHPPAPFLPWVYAPWTLSLFVPWALLPWNVAWFLVRAADILLLAWSAHWAYQRRPLATAVVLAVLAAPIAATFDTGNITFFLSMMIWATAFTGPRTAGSLWALATALKWFPGVFLLILSPRARLWGVAALAVSGVLVLATWPDTLSHLDLAFNFPRPFRLDLLLLGWGAVPWLWRQDWFWSLDRARLVRLWTDARGRLARDLRLLRGTLAARPDARREVGQRLRAFFGSR